MGTRLVVFGAGGFAKEAIDALEACGTPPECVFDDNQALWGTSFMGYKVAGGRDALVAWPRDGLGVVVAIARPDVRSAITRELLAAGLRLVGLRHPSASISRHALVADSAHVMHGAVVSPCAQVAEHALVDMSAFIGHDAVVGAFVHVAPGALMGGGVEVGEGALVGLGARIAPARKVGAWATVGAGAVVVRDVRDKATVFGVPAREVPS